LKDYIDSVAERLLISSINGYKYEGDKMAYIKIVAFGDGITLGTLVQVDSLADCLSYQGTTVNLVRESQTWRSVLGRILSDWIEDEVKVISAGVGGDTTQEGLLRLDKDVLSYSPDYVLIMFGLNDANRNIGRERYKKNLEEMVARVAKQGIKPIIMTPPPFSERRTIEDSIYELSEPSIYEIRECQKKLRNYAQIARDLANEKSLPLIDFHSYFLGSSVLYDHLINGHPDGVAQSWMASFIAAKLSEILKITGFPTIHLTRHRNVYSDIEHTETKHNAFTDITFFEGQFYLAFRNAISHCSPPPSVGKIIVLKSSDGISWEREAILKVPGFDNRDPKFLQVGRQLMLYAPCVTLSKPDCVVTYGFEKIGRGKWSKPFKCSPGVFWRPRKWRDQYVVAVYGWPDKTAAVKLLSSKDGYTWKVTSNILPYETGGNETDLFVENDKLIAFSRTDPLVENEKLISSPGPDIKDIHNMLISTYISSKKHWKTVSSGRIIQAPCLFKTRKRIMVIGRYMSQSDKEWRKLREDWTKFAKHTPGWDDVDPARIEEYHQGLRTGIFLMDGVRPRLVMELLSGGDNGYAGVIQYGEEYVISNYSMHEHYRAIHHLADLHMPADIYISGIRIE